MNYERYERLDPEQLRRCLPQFADEFGHDAWKVVLRDFSVDDYIAWYPGEESIHLVVRVLEWGGPSSAYDSWVIVQRFPMDTPRQEIQRAKESLVNDPTFFRVCVYCRKRLPVGYFNDDPDEKEQDDCCMGCSASEFGVIY